MSLYRPDARFLNWAGIHYKQMVPGKAGDLHAEETKFRHLVACNSSYTSHETNCFKSVYSVFTSLTIEIHRMWNVKITVIPVIIGATGTISKLFRKYVGNIPGSHEVRELQKTAILGTAHILRKVLT